MESLNNKVAFVTGGSRGIDQEIVRKLASEGAAVAFTYNNSEEIANILAKGLASITQQERDAIYLRWNESALEKTTLQKTKLQIRFQKPFVYYCSW